MNAIRVRDPRHDRVREALAWWEQIGDGPTSSILGNGAIAWLERTMADWIGVRHALALPSASVGLRLALDAVGVRSGDEVIVPRRDWTAARAAARELGAIPVIAEVLEPDGTIDPREVARLACPRTRAVVVTHLAGVPARMSDLQDLSHALGVPIIEDCAQALGVTIDDRRVGSFGAVGVFSFGPGKRIDAGEAGILVTDERALWEHAVRRSQHPARLAIEGLDQEADPTLQARIHPVAAVVAAHALCVDGW